MNTSPAPTYEAVQKDLLNLVKDVLGSLLDEETVQSLGGYSKLVKSFEDEHDSLHGAFRFCVEGRVETQWGVIPRMAPLFQLSILCKYFGGNLAQSKYSALAHLKALYTARSRLDGDAGTETGPEPLEVKDIAILADMSEASVRNATSRGELSTYKEGSSTLISNSAARAWLIGRRGYRRTQYDRKDLDALINPPGDSLSLGQYLTSKRTETLAVETLVSLLEKHPTVNLTANELSQLESGNLTIPISRFHQIAEIYQEDPESFIDTLVDVYGLAGSGGTDATPPEMQTNQFLDYERDDRVEGLFGQPDVASWALYKAAESEATKGAVVRALHIIIAASGKETEYARDVLNKYTLALYRKNPSDQYLSDAYNNQRSYSEPTVYGFIYDENQMWSVKQSLRTGQLNKTEIALKSPWATHVMEAEDVAPDQVGLVFRKLLQRYG